MDALITGAVIGIIGTLLGTIATGVINYILNRAQFMRDKIFKQKNLIQQKLEEIGLLIEDIDNTYGQLLATAVGHVTTGEKLESEIKPLPMIRLKMLIDYYAPGLKGLFQVLEQSQYNFGILFAESVKSEPSQKVRILELLFMANFQSKNIRQSLANAAT